MAFNFGIWQIDGMNREQFFKKLEDEKTIVWVELNGYKAPSLHLKWLSAYFKNILNLVVFHYGTPDTKETLKRELTKFNWIESAARTGLSYGHGGYKLYIETLRAMYGISEWFRIVYLAGRLVKFDDDIYNWVSWLESGFISDYYGRFKQHKKEIK